MNTLITFLGIMLFSMAASAQDGEVYEYLTMVKHHNSSAISVGTVSSEEENYKDEVEDAYGDLRPIHK